MLQSYTSVLKAQSVCSVHRSILNKSQTRVTAEWILYSIVSYVMVECIGLFLPDIEVTEYHLTKKDLTPSARDMWDMAERSYSNMIGNQGKKSILSLFFPI